MKQENKIVYLNGKIEKYFKNNQNKFNKSFQLDNILKETFINKEYIDDRTKAILIPNKSIIIYNEIISEDEYMKFLNKFIEYAKKILYSNQQLKKFLDIYEYIHDISNFEKEFEYLKYENYKIYLKLKNYINKHKQKLINKAKIEPISIYTVKQHRNKGYGKILLKKFFEKYKNNEIIIDTYNIKLIHLIKNLTKNNNHNINFFKFDDISLFKLYLNFNTFKQVANFDKELKMFQNFIYNSLLKITNKNLYILLTNSETNYNLFRISGYGIFHSFMSPFEEFGFDVKKEYDGWAVYLYKLKDIYFLYLKDVKNNKKLQHLKILENIKLFDYNIKNNLNDYNDITIIFNKKNYKNVMQLILNDINNIYDNELDKEELLTLI